MEVPAVKQLVRFHDFPQGVFKCISNTPLLPDSTASDIPRSCAAGHQNGNRGFYRLALAVQ
jgi:hypothetical protein